MGRELAGAGRLGAHPLCGRPGRILGADPWVSAATPCGQGRPDGTDGYDRSHPLNPGKGRGSSLLWSQSLCDAENVAVWVGDRPRHPPVH